MMVILTSTARKKRSLLGPALVIGAAVGLEAFVAGPICGASMNPARSLGPAIVAKHYLSIWVYILGPILGALLGSIVFIIFNENYRREDKPEI